MLIIISFFVLNTAFAQWSNKWHSPWNNDHLLYTHGDLMVGNYNGGEIGLSFVLKSKISMQFGFSAVSNQPSSNPANYLKKASQTDISNNPLMVKNTENFHFMLGRVFTLNTKRVVRFVAQGGPGLFTSMENINGQIELDNKKRSLSLMLNTKVEFPLTNSIGISAGPTYIFNKESSFLGCSIGFMYGIIKSRSSY